MHISFKTRNEPRPIWIVHLNWEENGRQELIALVEGDEARIVAFRQMVEKNKPVQAEMFTVTFEDYDGDVGRTSEVAMLCTFV